MTDPHDPTPTRPTRARVRLTLAGAGLLVALASWALTGCATDAKRRDRPPLATRQSNAERASASIERARQLAEVGVTTEALEEFERAIQFNPTLTVAYLGAAEIYRQQGDYNLAEQRARRAAELSPQLYEAHYAHGLALQLLSRIGEAIRAYLRALAIDADSFDANLNLATAYLQINEPLQARPFAERAVELNVESGPARANLGAVYAALGEHDRAVLEYQQAAELMDLSPQLLLNLADSLGMIDRHAEMAVTLEQLIRIEPGAVAYERLGSARFRLREYPGALDAFRRAAGIDPAHFPAWNGIGVCLLNEYLWSDRTDVEARREALDVLRRSLRLKPNQPQIIELVRRYG